ncbi:MAG: manganese efflux pump MntP family protein [Candidatus Zixiibacteriota bacterium]
MILLTSIGLSMDCFAVSIANGLSIRNLRLSKLFFNSTLFGLFHIVMPLIGWICGAYIVDEIAFFDHWIAFGLLSFVGGKMIYEPFAESYEQEIQKSFELKRMFLQAIATSIDAFAVGISLAVLEFPMMLVLITMGITTFIFSFIGHKIGKFFGKYFRKKAEIFGGVILILIGLKILIEHLYLK